MTNSKDNLSNIRTFNTKLYVIESIVLRMNVNSDNPSVFPSIRLGDTYGIKLEDAKEIYRNLGMAIKDAEVRADTITREIHK